MGKMVLSLVIVFLSAVLVSLLSVQDNESGNGILYVKTYVPADLQITKGSLMEGMMGMETVQEIWDKEIKEMKEDPDIIKVQDFKVNYDRSVFLCEEISKLNRESSYYEAALRT